MRCGANSLVGYDGNDAGVYPLTCKRWSCRHCGPKKVRRVMAQLRDGMQLGRTRFFTLTAPGDEDAATSWDEFPYRWKLFHQRVKRKFPDFEYLGVVEVQRRGHPHIHVVYRGGYIHWPVLRSMARASGFGRVADIRDARGGHAKYLVKYLTKELRPPAKLDAERAGGPAAPAPRHFRRVRMSKGWCDAQPRPASRWRDWRIVPVPPVQAVLEVQRAGYGVVELVVGPLRTLVQQAARLRWLRSLRDRFDDKPRPDDRQAA